MLKGQRRNFVLGVLMLIAVMFAFAGAARAAEVEATKTTGAPLAVGAYANGDTLVVTGDALELGEEEDDMGDWGILAALPNSFKLRFENGQTVIPEVALMDARLLEIEGRDVTEIGGWAFAYTPLTKAVFPAVENIEENPFVVISSLNADGLQLNEDAFSVDADNGILYSEDGSRIVSYLFTNNATAFTAPKGVTEIADSAFAAAMKLESVSLPNVRLIGDSAFVSSGKIKTLSAPNVVRVGSLAFLQCTGLTTLYLPKAEILDYQAFAACQNLTGASLPNVKSIGEGAFFNNSKLASISIPKAEFIGEHAFASMHGLTVLELGAEVPVVSGDAFTNNQKKMLLLTPAPENFAAALADFQSVEAILRAEITQSPVTLLEGDKLTLSAVIENTAAPYQWSLNRTALPAATETLYEKEAAAARDLGLYAMQFGYNGKTYSTAPIGVAFAVPELSLTPAAETVAQGAQADRIFTLRAHFGDKDFTIADFNLAGDIDDAGLMFEKTGAATFRVHGIPTKTGSYSLRVTAKVSGYADDFTTGAVITVTEGNGGTPETPGPGTPCYTSGSSGCSAVSLAGLSLLLIPLALMRGKKK